MNSGEQLLVVTWIALVDVGKYCRDGAWSRPFGVHCTPAHEW